MINKDRIVPVTATDLITLYSVILTGMGNTIYKLEPVAPGIFEINTDAESGLVCTEPVKELTFDAGVSDSEFFFLADYDFKGFFQSGAELSVSGDEIIPDGVTPYAAVLGSGAVAVSKIGL